MKTFLLKFYYKFRYLKERYTCNYNKLISLIIKPPIVNLTDETLEKIINEKCSVSRFGDGEFNIVLKGSIFFQARNNALRLRLTEILRSQDSNHIVCIPDVFSNQNRFTEQAKKHWVKYLAFHRSKIYRKLDMKKEYYDAMVTRLYMDYKDKSKAKERFLKFRMIWDGREVVLVEGEQSRLGIGNDLLSNARSIKRIICPAINAFEKYDEILATVKKQDQSKLILLALGPTATVLAFDLSKMGYQAVDIGNVDIEYEWFLKRAEDKFAVKNKYIGEVPNGANVGEIHDQKYESEIYLQIL
jgi:glycosyltransferase family protein